MSESKSSAQEIDSSVWRLMEVFREAPLAPEDLLRFTVALILIKFVSDLARDKSARKTDWRPAWHDLVVPPGLSWDDLRSRSNDRDLALLDQYLGDIYRCNRDILGNGFGYVEFEEVLSRMGRRIADEVLDLVSEIDLRPSRFSKADDLCELIERLLLRFAFRIGPRGAEYYVPHALSTLLAELAEPRPGEDILDPACGSGFLLTRLAKHTGLGHGQVLGQDRGGSMADFCKINMFFQGIKVSRLELANPITSPMLSAKGGLLKADVVVSNPPFGLRLGERYLHERADLYVYGLGPRSRSEYLYLAHMLQVAREDIGRVGIIVPRGVLFGKEGETLRKLLVESNLVALVVDLPSKLFHGTKIPVSVLIIDKGKKREDYLFIDASRAFESEGRLNRIPDREAQRIVEVFKSYADVPGFSRRVSLDEIRTVGYQLSVPLYVEPSSKKDLPQDIDEISREIREIEEELSIVQKEIALSAHRLNPESTVTGRQSPSRRKRADKAPTL